MNKQKDNHLGYETLALAIAVVWGSAFAFQKTAMQDTGPWLFVGLRFFLAIPVLAMMAWWFERDFLVKYWRLTLKYSLVPGMILALSSILQQQGLLSSYAAKAGLITVLYVCIIPFASCFFGYHLKLREVIAAVTAFTGLFFLSITGSFSISFGDTLLIISAFGWTAHIIALDIALRHVKPFCLALFQTVICALAANMFVPFVEMDSIIALTNNFTQIMSALWFELFYTSVISVGLAFGLQVLAQQHLSPNRVGLLFSMEGLFAVFFGWLLLGELLNQREIFGALLMIASLIIVRIKAIKV